MPSQKCDGCGSEFKSRNAVFRHLKETNGACLDPEDYRNFKRYVLLQDRKKVLLLYGYLILPAGQEFSKKQAPWRNVIVNGQDAATKLLATLEEYIMPPDDDKESTNEDETGSAKMESLKICRSYGNSGRAVEILKQDDRTGAITEVLATKLPDMEGNLEEWLSGINALLDQKGYAMRVLGRLPMPQAKFNAEMDANHRRVEYLLPADFLVPGQPLSLSEFYDSLPSFVDGFHNRSVKALQEQDLPSDSEPQQQEDTTVEEEPDIAPPLVEEETKGSQQQAMNTETSRPSHETLNYLTMLKKTMQRLTTKVVDLDANNEGAVLEKQFHKQKRKRQRHKTDNRERPRKTDSEIDTTKQKGEGQLNGKETTKTSIKKTDKPIEKATQNGHAAESNDDGEKAVNKIRVKKVLRRRRFHNFTPKSMAHDYFVYRRMDRMYHRATLRFPEQVYKEVEEQQQQQPQPHSLDRNRPFLAVSISGDMFLHGQACRVVGVLIALARGVVDRDFVDCVFDEDYPHLVPTPEVPTFAMYAGECYYTNWEGKVKKVLTPRKCDLFAEGWNDPETLLRVHEWQAVTREEIAKAWLLKGVDPEDRRLLEEKKWTENVLEPWAAQARRQLEEYRLWRKSKMCNDAKDNLQVSLPPLSSIDNSVPLLYQKVLQCLREADASGLWPSTTPKRQMVMVSTAVNDASNEDGKKASGFSSLSVAHMVARNNKLERSSAYEFREGDGGASGSFSVGAMPGDQCTQPKANKMFPDLMLAAFELERALLPDREPSSTIAINRNAQFRPHTDSGAGVGQSTSLIVALGDYVGGELVVEGKKEDIRYRPLEFNGWKQRHWTMPFDGERFSLVWFTPKGCEGVRGIDLCT